MIEKIDAKENKVYRILKSWIGLVIIYIFFVMY